jgi:hypothetical protein
LSGLQRAARPEFKYLEMTAEQRLELLKGLVETLEGVPEVLFAYVHGSFVERPFFRDLDVALWLRDSSKAFYYTVDFSATLEVEVGVPVDLQVLNEAPLPFKFHVFAEGRLLFSRDEGLRMRLVDETLRHYFDIKLLTESVLESLKKKDGG